ncbi:MAG: glutamine synthetase [Gemmatimonadetes bacterium]|nr:glutamine synthetase [Gemmatimonadota bacterium]
MRLDPDIDTVAIAVPDSAGRLIGKRVTLDTWSNVAEGGIAMPDFHLITDATNAPVDGMAAAGIHVGFRNGTLIPDLETLRRYPWYERTAGVICDAHRADGSPALVAPRAILRAQTERLGRLGLVASCASEIEFYVFRNSYEDLHLAGRAALVPAYHRHADHDILVSGVNEDLIGDVRRSMEQAGIAIELSQGEGGAGQHEVTLRHCEPLEMADRHVVYKHGVKALALKHALSATFMAKVFDDQPGSSCHVHLSIRDASGGNALAGADGLLGEFGRAFVAGLLAHAPSMCVLYAPNANSYRRLQPDSWAPANLTWGYDNRTCLVRVIGAGPDRRIEFRLPGADANPYHALTGIIASGLAGVVDGHVLPEPVTGDGYASEVPRLPRDLTEALALFAESAVARDAVGPEVHAHLVQMTEHELSVSRREVTDRDLVRWFEVA